MKNKGRLEHIQKHNFESYYVFSPNNIVRPILTVLLPEDKPAEFLSSWSFQLLYQVLWDQALS